MIHSCFHQTRQNIGNILGVGSPVQQRHEVHVLREFGGAKQGSDHQTLLGRSDQSRISLDQVQGSGQSLTVVTFVHSNLVLPISAIMSLR